MAGFAPAARAGGSCGGSPVMSRSIANSSSMRLTTSMAIGALLMRASLKSLRPARQHYRLGDRPRFARPLVDSVEPGVGVRLCEARNFDLRVVTRALDYGRLANLEALAVIHVIHIRGSLCRDITPVC